MIAVATFLPPTVIDGLNDDGTFSLKLNSSSSSSSATVSTIIGTLTLLVFIILANVAVSVVVLKSIPPVN